MGGWGGGGEEKWDKDNSLQYTTKKQANETQGIYPLRALDLSKRATSLFNNYKANIQVPMEYFIAW